MSDSDHIARLEAEAATANEQAEAATQGLEMLRRELDEAQMRTRLQCAKDVMAQANIEEVVRRAVEFNKHQTANGPMELVRVAVFAAVKHCADICFEPDETKGANHAK